jgi:hypothetical protein
MTCQCDADIAEASYDAENFKQVWGVLLQRFASEPKHWRRIYKVGRARASCASVQHRCVGCCCPSTVPCFASTTLLFGADGGNVLTCAPLCPGKLSLQALLLTEHLIKNSSQHAVQVVLDGAGAIEGLKHCKFLDEKNKDQGINVGLVPLAGDAPPPSHSRALLPPHLLLLAAC